MTPELEKKLVEKYPKIFSVSTLDSRMPFPMFGIECGDGWYDLLDTLCGAIQHHLKYNAADGVEQVVVEQIKEKFGTLRFYERGGDAVTSAYISLAEQMSSRICEECGNRGILRGGGWIRSQCDTHADGREVLHSELSRLP